MSKAISAYADENRTIRMVRPLTARKPQDGLDSKTILVVDSHPLVADGIGSLLRETETRGRVLYAATISAAMEVVRDRMVDIVLVARFVGDESGLEVLRRVRQYDDDLPVIVLSISQTANAVREAVAAGATGYIVETAPREVIVQAIDLALRGERLALLPLTCVAEAVSPPALQRSFADPSASSGKRHARLTRQEAKVLGHITEGLSNKEIARELGIFEGTVKVHVKAILRKLNAKNRTVAALMAVGAECVAP